MTIVFYDTIAIGKYYNPEVGSPRVQQLLSVQMDGHVISRLSVVEMSSVFAKKVRTGQLSSTDYQLLTNRFQLDVKSKKYTIVRLLVAQLKIAERLIKKHGINKNLRTLDAIQLSIALSLHNSGNQVRFVCADQALCDFAILEGLAVINPEIP